MSFIFTNKKSIYNLMILTIAIFCFSKSIYSAELKENLSCLGYSKEMQLFAETEIKRMNNIVSNQPENNKELPENKILSEADSVKEQLAELAKTRGILPNTNFHTERLKSAIEEYWKKQSIKSSYEPRCLSEELRKQLNDRIRQAVESKGYKIKKLEILDAPASLGIPQARLIIRVVRPLKTKNHYKEIQNNLLELKQVCVQAATIDGVRYIRELTTFIAENPKNNYYYERTILTNN